MYNYNIASIELALRIGLDKCLTTVNTSAQTCQSAQHTVTMAPSIDNPESWLEYAEPDAELQQVSHQSAIARCSLKSSAYILPLWRSFKRRDELTSYLKMLDAGIKPRFTGSDGLAGLSKHREEFNAIFHQDAAAARERAGDAVKEEEIFIPTRDGTRIRALLYQPTHTTVGGRPLATFIHGGGFIVGTADMETPPCIAVAKAYDCICISLEYRLSPEVKFPVAYNDCWDAIVWVRHEICPMMKSILTMNTVVEECSASMGSRSAEGLHSWWSVRRRAYLYTIVSQSQRRRAQPSSYWGLSRRDTQSHAAGPDGQV